MFSCLSQGKVIFIMKQAKVLSDTEFKRVLAVVAAGRHAERNRMAIMLSHYAGLRVGEISKLKVGDILLEDGSISDQLYLNPSYTKGGHSRTVFINAKLSKELQKYMRGLSALSTRLRTRRLSSDAPLLQSQKRGAFTANGLCQLFGTVYTQAGLKGCSSHSGRRGFISKLAHSGVSSKVIMELAGHKHLTTTQRYIDVTDDHKRAAVEII